MPNEIENLLNAEREVQNLLEELQTLQQQVGGYDTARQNLEGARQSLLGLVEKTSALTEKTHSTIENLARIGTPEILERCEHISQAISCLATEMSSRYESIDVALVALSGEVTAGAEANRHAIAEGSAASAKETNGLRKFAIAGLTVSIVSVLISLTILVLMVKR